ncbi:MAG: 9-O-acetylesterase, partial [Muribaculaceae bacterium]|nr:9-O-acetylesterase [Muribaculaceae bacterium]
RARKDVQPHSDWGYLRESQARALHMPYTGMAVTIDIGEADDIHPKNKQEVARRLSLIALARDYGRKVGYRAPAYRDYSIEGDTCYITFDAPSSAFMKSDVSLDGFIIAGTDGQFYKAEARWAGDRLAVSSPHVRVPVAVRYAWADNPAVSLYGRNMLPVAPFRTDTW